MSEHAAEIHEAVRRVLPTWKSVDCVDVPFDDDSWSRLDQLDFTSISASAEIGGAGGDLSDAATVVAAAVLAPLCLAEATMLAGPALTDAGIDWPEGVVTGAAAADVRLHTSSDRYVASGSVDDVAWARRADHVVLIIEDGQTAFALVIATADQRSTEFEVIERMNAAGEARDTLILNDAPVLMAAQLPAPWSVAVGTDLLATARATQIAAAARLTLEMCALHTSQRVQFGRTLDKFQAVQHRLAGLASSVVQMENAAQTATRELTREFVESRNRREATPVGFGRPLSIHAELAVAAAKSEVSSLVSQVASDAHQLHGAIGFTREHRLGQATTRMWAWRDEVGNERYWDERVSELLDVADRDVWALISGTSGLEGLQIAPR